MPIYEYACGSCEHQFETIQKASEEPLRDCPACGEKALKKLLSAPVFRLKGGGWYETDFKTGDKRNVSDTGDDKAGNGAADAADAGKAATDAPTTASDTSDRSTSDKAADPKRATASTGGASASKPAAASETKAS